VDFLTFFQQFINGLFLGSLYSPIAIGYTLVWIWEVFGFVISFGS
jgi:branched-subunit amino acid ABC-type transport system permease component